MRRMLREGHRRSPRISALDARKAQPSRPKTPVAQSRFSASTNTNLHVAAGRQVRKRRRKRHSEGPASRTRAKKKRKLRPLHDVAASPALSAQQDAKSDDEQDEIQTSCEDLAVNNERTILQLQIEDSRKHENQVNNQPHTVPCKSRMPGKRMLELVLDVLQRRDTHEIFAEPVDPDEVEDYYEIIKEPMDFGTMRAKLHEGMYNTLEQFEHDVFLISKNAMHFNSSSTIYFRQARAIDELARKVFHALKSDPQNFELEFSGSRRRNNRRPKGDSRSSAHNSSSKLATNSRSNTATFNVPQKPIPFSASSILNFRTAMHVIPSYFSSDSAIQFNSREDEMPFGSGEGRGFSSSEADRRSTYKPQLSILDDNYSIVSKIHSNSKLVMQGNQQDIGYRESLMSFVKGLGPTAQKVAQRKLNGRSTEATNCPKLASNCSETPNSKNVTSSSDHWLQTEIGMPTKRCLSVNNGNTNRIDMCETDKGERPHSGVKMRISGASIEAASHGNCGNIFSQIRPEAQSRNNVVTAGVCRIGFLHKQSSMIHTVSNSSITNARDQNFSVMELENKDEMHDKSESSDSASKYANSNVLQHKLSNGYSFPPSSWPLDTMATSTSGYVQNIGFMKNASMHYQRSYDQSVAGFRSGNQKLCTSSDTDLRLTSVPQFAFDLPFLKTQLDQMNSVGAQQSSGGQTAFLDRMNETYQHDNHMHSLDTQLTGLVLQL